MESTARRNADQLTASRRKRNAHKAVSRFPECCLPPGGKIPAPVNNLSETLVGKSFKRRHNPRRTTRSTHVQKGNGELDPPIYGASERQCSLFRSPHAPAAE